MSVDLNLVGTAAEVLQFDRAELWGAAIVGLVAGIGAVIFSRMLKMAKSISTSVAPYQRILGGGIILGGIVLLTDWLYDGIPLSLGPERLGDNVLEWVLSTDHSIGILLLLLGIRMVATSVTVGAGGVGGVFIPLAVMGLIAGRAVGELVGDDTAVLLFPFIGLAAFLGAGYRTTPLTSVMFVAESTGRTEFVVAGVDRRCGVAGGGWRRQRLLVPARHQVGTS